MLESWEDVRDDNAWKTKGSTCQTYEYFLLVKVTCLSVHETVRLITWPRVDRYV